MKKIVDLLETNSDLTQSIFGRVILERGAITYEGLSEKFIGILEEGIIGYANDGFLYPADGLKFMEALKVEFSGSMIRASEVREEK